MTALFKMGLVGILAGLGWISTTHADLVKHKQQNLSTTDQQELQAGLWHDPKTNLIWMRCSLGQIWDGQTCQGTATLYRWKEAQQALQQFNEQGGWAQHQDWVLPHVEDLSSLRYCLYGFTGTVKIPSKMGGEKQIAAWCTQNNNHQPSLDSQIFPKTRNTWYWSATPYVGADYVGADAWAVYFGYGQPTDVDEDDRAAVRFVRVAD